MGFLKKIGRGIKKIGIGKVLGVAANLTPFGGAFNLGKNVLGSVLGSGKKKKTGGVIAIDPASTQTPAGQVLPVQSGLNDFQRTGGAEKWLLPGLGAAVALFIVSKLK